MLHTLSLRNDFSWWWCTFFRNLQNQFWNTQLMGLKHATFYTCLIFIESQCENIRSKRCIAHDYTAFANYRLFQYYAILSWNIFKEIQITQLPDIITRHH